MNPYLNKKAIVSKRGQWDYPGQDTIVPTPDGSITMQGVNYPVYGQDETGYGQMMYPNKEYQFPGNMVYETPMMGKGGTMIKRADGSYSKRGLWDNIRANKGSGKKPTEQMLEQEKKIKKQEMQSGGKANPYLKAQYGTETLYLQGYKDIPQAKPVTIDGKQVYKGSQEYKDAYESGNLMSVDYDGMPVRYSTEEAVVTAEAPAVLKQQREREKDPVAFAVREGRAAFADPFFEFSGIKGAARFAEDPMKNISGAGNVLYNFTTPGLAMNTYNYMQGKPFFNISNEDLEGLANTADVFGLAAPFAKPITKGLSFVPKMLGKVSRINPNVGLRFVDESLDAAKSLQKADQSIINPVRQPQLAANTAQAVAKEYTPWAMQQTDQSIDASKALNKNTYPSILENPKELDAAKSYMDFSDDDIIKLEKYLDDVYDYNNLTPYQKWQLLDRETYYLKKNNISINDRINNNNILQQYKNDYTNEIKEYFNSPKFRERVNKQYGLEMDDQSLELLKNQLLKNLEKKPFIRPDEIDDEVAAFYLRRGNKGSVSTRPHGHTYFSDVSAKNKNTAYHEFRHQLTNAEDESFLFPSQQEIEDNLIHKDLLKYDSDLNRVFKDGKTGRDYYMSPQEFIVRLDELKRDLSKVGYDYKTQDLTPEILKKYQGLTPREAIEQVTGKNNVRFSELSEKEINAVHEILEKNPKRTDDTNRLLHWFKPEFLINQINNKWSFVPAAIGTGAAAATIGRGILNQEVPQNRYGGETNPYLKARSGIYIKPENRGKFTEWAQNHDMGVQEAANKVMANKEDYSTSVVKMANFAKNAAGWNKGQDGLEANLPEAPTNMFSDYNPISSDYTAAMTGMMKARMATDAEFGNTAAKRMTSLYPKTYTFTGDEMFYDEKVDVPAGATGTHYTTGDGNVMFPIIQEGQDGNLFFNRYANPYNKEAMRFESPQDASYFSENYKNIAPMMYNAKEGQFGLETTKEDAIKEIDRNVGYIMKGKEIPTGVNMTKLNPDEEYTYKKWVSSLTPNLKYSSEDKNYDTRGAWKTGVQPELFDENFIPAHKIDVTQDRSIYEPHLFTNDPNTGRYLKGTSHPSYMHAIIGDMKGGYTPTMDLKGNMYAKKMKKGGESDLVPVEVERSERIYDQKGNLLKEIPADAPTHEEGGVKLYLRPGTLVFPKKYYKALDAASGLPEFNKIKEKMLDNAEKAYLRGEPYSSGGRRN